MGDQTNPTLLRCYRRTLAATTWKAGGTRRRPLSMRLQLAAGLIRTLAASFLRQPLRYWRDNCRPPGRSVHRRSRALDQAAGARPAICDRCTLVPLARQPFRRGRSWPQRPGPGDKNQRLLRDAGRRRRNLVDGDDSQDPAARPLHGINAAVRLAPKAGSDGDPHAKRAPRPAVGGAVADRRLATAKLRAAFGDHRVPRRTAEGDGAVHHGGCSR